eukprot:Rhum_TRINITY_DN14453_c1_g1::Rhum_TRINITY_DN14453_c1_g1_i3::g.88005::m.88005
MQRGSSIPSAANEPSSPAAASGTGPSPADTVAVIDPGFLSSHVVGGLALRGLHVRLLCTDVYATYRRLQETGVDMTMVSLVDGCASRAADVATVMEGCTRAMYLGFPTQACAPSEGFHRVTLMVDAAKRRSGPGGVAQLLLLSSAGTSRPWAVGTVLANRGALTLGWQRRAEDAVRSSGTAYVVLKAGRLAVHRGAGGWRGILVRQGDLFGTQGFQKPGLHAAAAAATCVEALGMEGRRVTLDVVGAPAMADCTEAGYDWASCLGVLMDDAPWSPPAIDALLQHDRAVLTAAIVTTFLPFVTAASIWLAYSLYNKRPLVPEAHPKPDLVVLLSLGAMGVATLALVCFWRKTLLPTGCCCCFRPLAYSTKGAAGGAVPSQAGSSTRGHNVNRQSQSWATDSEAAAILC